MNLFDLYAELTLDTSGYESGINSANSMLGSLESSASSASSTLSKVGSTNSINSSGLESDLGDLSDALNYVEGNAEDADADISELGNSYDNSGILSKLSQLKSKILDTGDSSDASSSKLSAFGIMAGNIAANAVTQLIGKLGDLITNMVEVGMETETSFAQLETIAGTENIDALKDSLVDLSTETGTAAGELAETAYNAISAGSSAEEAAGMVEAAGKLATAGFTDTESALSVLSTTINAYGMEADDATSISDSLIQVQNLGVTTIDELASSMGKAISTASAYNVDLGNLESSYVSLTKAGISTEESTTYLSSMLNELGDSGSDVAGIIEEETGKSFSELMDSGYSLGDVMGILYESCDEDATALMNLWSSAEAGKASNAIVSQGLEEFNTNLETIENSSGATEDAYSIMTDTLSFKTSQMKTSMQNVGLQIFETLEPLLSLLADLMVNYVIPAISQVVTWIGNLIALITKLVKRIISLFQDTIIPWVKKLISVVQPIIQKIVDFVTSVIKTIKKVITNTLKAIKKTITTILKAIKTAVTTPVKAIKKIVTTALNAIKKVVSNVLGKIKDTFTNIFSKTKDKVMDILSNLRESIANWGSNLKEKFRNIGKNLIQGMWKGISDKVSWVIDKITGLKDKIVKAVKKMFGISSPSKVFAEIGGYMAEGLGVGWENEIDNVIKTIDSDLDYGTATVASSASALGAASRYNAGVSVTQNIYSKAQTAADLMREARWQQERAVLSGV